MDNVLLVEVLQSNQYLCRASRRNNGETGVQHTSHFWGEARGERRRSLSPVNYLEDEKLGAPFGEPAVGAIENHLQHVPVHLLHDDVDLDPSVQTDRQTCRQTAGRKESSHWER